MSYRTLFTPNEWRMLEFAPFWVLNLVGGVDENIDDQELETFAREVFKAEVCKEAVMVELLNSISAHMNTVILEHRQEACEDTEGLQDAANIIDKKLSPDEASAFKLGLITLAKKISEASGGGVLGIGDKVSKAEETAIKAISLALRL